MFNYIMVFFCSKYNYVGRSLRCYDVKEFQNNRSEVGIKNIQQHLSNGDMKFGFHPKNTQTQNTSAQSTPVQNTQRPRVPKAKITKFQKTQDQNTQCPKIPKAKIPKIETTIPIQ